MIVSVVQLVAGVWSPRERHYGHLEGRGRGTLLSAPMVATYVWRQDVHKCFHPLLQTWRLLERSRLSHR
jgi:hypothetical protein